MPKYWVKNYFTHGRFPEVGQKQKTEKEKKKRKLVITMAKLCMAPGPICRGWNINGFFTIICNTVCMFQN